MRQLIGWVRQAGVPCIVSGDLNALPYTPEYWALARHLVDCTRAVSMNSRNTRPTWGLPTQLDYISQSRATFTPAHAAQSLRSSPITVQLSPTWKSGR